MSNSMPTLIRSRHDPSIIAYVDPDTGRGVKLCRSKKPYPGEHPAGSIFFANEQNWKRVDNDDVEAKHTYRIFKMLNYTPVLYPL